MSSELHLLWSQQCVSDVCSIVTWFWWTALFWVFTQRVVTAQKIAVLRPLRGGSMKSRLADLYLYLDALRYFSNISMLWPLNVEVRWFFHVLLHVDRKRDRYKACRRNVATFRCGRSAQLGLKPSALVSWFGSTKSRMNLLSARLPDLRPCEARWRVWGWRH